MDFIDWTHVVLGALVENRHDPYIGHIELGGHLFGKEYANTNEYYESKQRVAIYTAVDNLVNLGLVDETDGNWQVNRVGRTLYENPYPIWESVCQQVFDADEEKLIRLVNRVSPQPETNTDRPCVWLREISKEDMQAEFGLKSDPATTEEMDIAMRFVFAIPKALASEGFVKDDPRPGWHNNIEATYKGLVWETRRGITSDSRFIDGLVEDWETTNVDFKRELHLDTKDDKGEFAKDILGLVNTKSCGRRFLIVGFDDKTRLHHSAPDPKVTQDRIEHILSNLTEPVVNVRYEVIDYRLGKVGKLEVIREPFKLPYRAADDVIGEKKKRLEKGAVYVRHGTHTVIADGDELTALRDEGRRAGANVGESNIAELGVE